MDMKKLLQIMLAIAMAVSCMCFVVACATNENKACEHEWAVVSETAATCIEDGEKTLKCTKCSQEKTEAGEAALGHDFKEENYTEKSAATCTTAQVLSCKCTRCDATKEKIGIDALGHDIVWTTTTEPTCTETGVKNGACSRCDYSEGDVIVAALGHNYGEWEETTAATCTEDGEKMRVCSRCNDKQTQVVPATGHTDSGTKEETIEVTCTTDGYTLRNCSVCGKDYQDNIVVKLGHDLSKTETVAVSCLTEGYETWSCSRGDYTEKREEKEKLYHAFDASNKCTNGCGLTIEDGFTWVSTHKFVVSYNKESMTYTLIGGDPGTNVKTDTIMLPALLFKTLKENGAESIKISLGELTGTTPVVGYKDSNDTDFAYANHGQLPYTRTITITDTLVANGYEFTVVYGDLTQRNSAWGATVKTTGFTLSLEPIKPFNINDKTLWVTSGYATTQYDATNDVWQLTDDTTQAAKEIRQHTVTISADVFKAMKAAGYTTFTITYKRQDSTSTPQFGYHDGSTWQYSKNNAASWAVENITITDDMVESGFSFTALCCDLTVRNAAWGGTTNVYGFNLSITFA